MMMTSLFLSLKIIIIVRPCCYGFVLDNQSSYNFLQRRRRRIHRQRQFYYSASNDYDHYDPKLIDAASILLEWERIEEMKLRPMLNLSATRDDESLEDNPNAINTDSNDMSSGTSSEEWDQGQRWEVTLQGLRDLGLFVVTDDDNNKGDDPSTQFLTNCPQLLRLDPTMVMETAHWIVNEFNSDYLESEPSLLSYRCSDVKYGLEFMSMMMMFPVIEATKTACSASPKLLLAGITGGIQEQYVKNALGKASDATRDANQRIAGDMMSSINQLKNSNKKGLL